MSADQRVLDDAFLQRVAVDQQRRMERAHAPHAGRVPGPGRGDSEIGPAGADVRDQLLLSRGLTVAPAVLRLDAERAVGEPVDFADESVDLARVEEHVGQREYTRFRFRRAAGSVTARGPAAGDQHGSERCGPRQAFPRNAGHGSRSFLLGIPR